MTQKQKEYVFDIEKELRKLEGGTDIKVYASIDLVRIQHTKIEKAYRMFCMDKSYTKRKIRETMVKLFDEIKKETA